MLASDERLNVDIIGAGISGLATAYFLSRYSSRVKIRVWEKDGQVGGLAGTFPIGDTFIEKFYHHIYRRDMALQDLIKEIGLWDDFVWEKASVGAYFPDRAYRLSTPIDILKFAPLSIMDRFRFAYLMLASRFIKNWEELDDVTAKDFIVKFAGEDVYRIMWEPLLRGKFGRYAGNISAAWLWRKLIDRGSRRLGGMEQLGYLRGGLSKAFEAIVDKLRSSGHHVHLNSPVKGFEISGDNVITEIHTAQGTVKTDYVICCSQTPQLSILLPDRFSEYKQQLDRIDFLANVCLVLILTEPLSKFYWNNIMMANCPFIGIIEHTRWTGTGVLEGKHLVYLSAYVADDDKRLSMTAQELCDHYWPYMQNIFSEFKRSQIEKSLVWSAPYTQPIVETGYRNIRPPMETPVGNLFLCTMAQIYPHDRQVSNGVEIAKKISEIISDRL